MKSPQFANSEQDILVAQGGDRAEMFVLVSKSTLDNLVAVTVSVTTLPAPGNELREGWTKAKPNR